MESCWWILGNISLGREICMMNVQTQCPKITEGHQKNIYIYIISNFYSQAGANCPVKVDRYICLLSFAQYLFLGLHLGINIGCWESKLCVLPSRQHLMYYCSSLLCIFINSVPFLFRCCGPSPLNLYNLFISLYWLLVHN